MASRDSEVSAARWLVGVTAGVALAFIAATAIAQGVQHAITSRSTDLTTNAMPSVKLLAAARGDIHQMEHDVEHASGSDSARAELERQAASARVNIDESLAAYVALPFFPQERALFAHVTDSLAVLDLHYATWKAAPDEASLATLRSDIALVDTALERVIRFDAEEGQRLGLEISSIHGSSIGLIVLVDAIAVLFAIGAVVLALRHLQRAARARRLEDAARETRELELRQANEALGQFSGRVAHDVLSPLSATSLSLELLRQICEDDEQALRAAERGAAAVKHVHALVDSLLSFARAGGKPEADARAELGPVLTELADRLEVEAEARDIELLLAPVPAGRVACSVGVLASIVSNLVQNALKYMGDARERRIDVHVLAVGPAWHFEVRDTGAGIAEDHQRRIFEPYVRVANAGPGIGLGLATVDRLVRAHGGNLGVRSSVGVGSTFWFELPKAQDVTHTADVYGMQRASA